MRKKTREPLDVAAINSAWENFFQKNKSHTLESLRKEGWIPVFEIAEKMKKSRKAVIAHLKNLGLDYAKFSVTYDSNTRKANFFKLKK